MISAQQATESSTRKRVLVLFAVRDEAKHFQAPGGSACVVAVSGIGKINAERALTGARVHRPQLVLTSGYCGGLNPEHKRGDVIFDADAESGIADALVRLGAKPGTFHCADRIITTAEEKKALRQLTGMDAVEMESGVIRALCRERGIPSATVRVISDDATQDLPMDFNKLSGADGNISYLKLAIALAKSPGLVPKLMHFQRELDACSRRLGGILHGLLAQTR